MNSFDLAFERTIGHEGKYSADPRDRGNWTSGECGQGDLKGTKWGISAAAYPRLNIHDLTLDEAKEIYRADYWAKIRGDELPDVIALDLFDAAVNHGVVGAIKMLQSALGVAVDGILGPTTLRAAWKSDQVSLAARFAAARLEFYCTLPNFHIYGRGWVRRVALNLKLIK